MIGPKLPKFPKSALAVSPKQTRIMQCGERSEIWPAKSKKKLDLSRGHLDIWIVRRFPADRISRLRPDGFQLIQPTSPSWSQSVEIISRVACLNFEGKKIEKNNILTRSWRNGLSAAASRKSWKISLPDPFRCSVRKVPPQAALAGQPGAAAGHKS